MAHIREGVTIPKSLKDVCILDILDGTTQDRPLTQEEIRQRLADRYGIEVDRKKMNLAQPIRELGTTTVEIRLHPQVSASLRVNVTEA